MTQPNRHRRLLLTSTAVLGGALLVGGLWSNRRHRPTKALDAKQAMLSSVIDTLVPRDQFPGGLDVGIDQTMFQQMAAQPKIQELVKRLQSSIDQDALTQHRNAFRQLNIDQREALLTSLWNNGSKPLVRRDFMQLRRLILATYYRSDAGHQSIGYQLPATYPNYLT